MFQDGTNKAYFIECHVPAQNLEPLFDFDTVLNPDDPDDPESEDYKLNRDIIEFNERFRKMQQDAETGRPFSNIIIEYNIDYRTDQPLKIIGGQHRARAIRDSVRAQKELARLHGIRVYIGISREQRAEISLTSNTNIAIAKALIDCFGEQQMDQSLGSGARMLNC